MITKTLEYSNYPIIIPKTLRDKTVNSRISREIYFIDCLNDLYYCSRSDISYHQIRSSLILRMLLVDKDCGIITIAKNFNINILFTAFENNIEGKQLTREEIINIKEKLMNYRFGASPYTILNLRNEPLKQYTLKDFIDLGCISFNRDEKMIFSVKNIINLVSNKSGAAHLEPTFDSSDKEAFFFGDFNPFSVKDGSVFLTKIKEISTITLDSLYPLAEKVIENLKNYNKEFVQAKVSITSKAITMEEFEESKRNTGS